MNVTFTPSQARGVVYAPPSKSLTHRLLIAAALGQGKSTIENVAPSRDIQATLNCLRILGADMQADTPRIVLGGLQPFSAAGSILPCGESASTLRFLLPLCLLSGEERTLTGSPRLLERPLSVYETLCRELGLRFDQSETAVTVQGPLHAGQFALRGDVSSQFVSGLLFALPLLRGDSTLRLLPPVESRPYIDMTLDVLSKFGISIIEKTENFFEISGNQIYSAANLSVEGDWSNAAPFFALQALGHAVSVLGLIEDSTQGDRVCVPYLDALRRGFATLDLADCPDLGPVLFALAGLLHGGRFTHTRRLRDKESDRVAAMQAELAKCGVTLHAEGDAVTVEAACPHAPAVPLSCHNDHRVAMALSVLLTHTGGTLAGAECVEKSYPAFFDDLRRLGISFTNH